MLSKMRKKKLTEFSEKNMSSNLMDSIRESLIQHDIAKILSIHYHAECRRLRKRYHF